MFQQTFFEQSCALLEDIDASEEKREWCKQYSIYTGQSEQDELLRALQCFIEDTYRNGLIITNEQKAIELYGLEESYILSAASEWLEKLPYLAVLACVTYHFRRDHFDNGALIRNSIASGAMLRMFHRLNTASFGPYTATTLETLYYSDCASIPEVPGIYWVLAPEGLDIQFKDAAENQSASLYSSELLIRKYHQCQDKEVLYIGKASGKKGLRQRICQYIKYGWNQAKNHKGGRAIWQIKNVGLLLLTYQPCQDSQDSIVREHELLRRYYAENGSYPLANWRG